MLHRRMGIKMPVDVVLPNGDGCEMRWGEGPSLNSAHPWLSGPAVYIPDSYTHSYQYPLVCVLHDHDRSERDLDEWFPAVSDQNYIGLGIRAPFPARSGLPGQFRWRGQRPDASWGAIASAISEVTQEWNIHPDRIFLHGVGNGGVIALQQILLSRLGVNDSDFDIAGISCANLPAWWPRLLPPVSTELRGRFLFLDECNEAEQFAAIDALRESGCEVTCASPAQGAPPTALNRWIMSSIRTTIW